MKRRMVWAMNWPSIEIEISFEPLEQEIHSFRLHDVSVESCKKWWNHVSLNKIQCLLFWAFLGKTKIAWHMDKFCKKHTKWLGVSCICSQAWAGLSEQAFWRFFKCPYETIKENDLARITWCNTDQAYTSFFPFELNLVDSAINLSSKYHPSLGHDTFTKWSHC